MIASMAPEIDFVIKVNNVDYVFHTYLSLGFLSITETIVYDISPNESSEKIYLKLFLYISTRVSSERFQHPTLS